MQAYLRSTGKEGGGDAESMEKTLFSSNKTKGGGGTDLALPHGHVQGVGAIQELHNLALGQRDAVLHRLLALPALPVGLALHKNAVAWLWGPIPPAT